MAVAESAKGRLFWQPQRPPKISYPIVGAWSPKRDTGVKDLVFLAHGCGLAMFSLPSLVSLWALTVLGSFRDLEQVHGPDPHGWSVHDLSFNPSRGSLCWVRAEEPLEDCPAACSVLLLLHFLPPPRLTFSPDPSTPIISMTISLCISPAALCLCFVSFLACHGFTYVYQSVSLILFLTISSYTHLSPLSVSSSRRRSLWGPLSTEPLCS